MRMKSEWATARLTTSSAAAKAAAGSARGRATLYTIAGSVFPGFLFLACLPVIRRDLDPSVFGYYMLCWSGVGMSAIFELGIGRAVTYFTGKQRSQGADAELAAAWTYLWALGALLSVAAAIGTWAFDAPVRSSDVSLAAWAALLATVPFGVLTAGYRGVLEGALHFGGAAALRAITVIALMGIPWVAGAIFVSAEAVGIGFLLARLVVLALHHAYERWAVGVLRRVRSAGTNEAAARVGGFIASMAVATSIGTLLGFLDRIVLASGSAVAAMADYLVPFELASRVTIVPAAVSSVLFALVSADGYGGDLKARVSQSQFAVSIFVIPVMAVLFVFSGPVLETWMGGVPTQASVRILQVLAVGVAFNSVAQVALATMQAAGGERVVMWIYLAELTPTILLTWWAFGAFGATGLSVAWTARCFVDCVALVLAQRRMHAFGVVQ